MHFNLIDILLIVGAAQGFILSLVLYTKRNLVNANYFLAMLIGIYSFVLLELFINESGIYLSYPMLQCILIGFSLTVFPFYYFYTKNLIYDTKDYLKNEWVHFIPFLSYKLYVCVKFFYDDDLFKDPTNYAFIILSVLIILQSIVYLVLIVRLLKIYSKKIRDVYSEIENLRLNWLSSITYITLIVVAIYIFEFILSQFDVSFGGFFDVSSFFAVANIYAIGYFGLARSKVFKEANLVESFELASFGNGRKKYEKSGLTEHDAQNYLKQLNLLMDTKKPYKNSNITLNDLATMCKVKPHNLSEILNTKLDQNFFDYINSYRVSEVKKLLLDPKNDSFTILALAFEAGFNSKTSFNTIFKKVTGKTPSQFKKESSL